MSLDNPQVHSFITCAQLCVVNISLLDRVQLISHLDVSVIGGHLKAENWKGQISTNIAIFLACVMSIEASGSWNQFFSNWSNENARKK